MSSSSALPAGPAPVARIGPNAIIRVAEVLPARAGAAVTAAVFESAGLARYLSEPPADMVDEAEVLRLHEALRRELGSARAHEALHAAGAATGDYLLAHRIPRPLQAVLRRVPARLAARVLLSAISRHAWTFVGSGLFDARPSLLGPTSRAWVVEIRDNPLCRGVVAEAPVCAFYAGTFERLFRELVHRDCRVREIACEACGDEACRLLISAD